MRYLALAALAVVACGAPPVPPPEGVPILSGAYRIEGERISASAECPATPSFFGADLNFDTSGQAQAPIPGFDCAFSYELSGFTVECHGWTYRLDGAGRITKGSAFGRATVEGGGCTGRVEFSITPKVKP